MPDSVAHPLVRTHPESGRKGLYLNPIRTEGIVGMDDAEGLPLLDELLAHAVQEKYQYRHRWQPGDVVMWDNRCLLHKANGDYDMTQLRYLYRVMLQGDVPECDAVKLYAFTCGTVTGEFAHLMEGGEGDITVPIPVFLIEHPKGTRAVRHRAAPRLPARPGRAARRAAAGLFRIGFQPGEEVSARLEAIDRDPARSTSSSTRISISTMSAATR